MKIDETRLSNSWKVRDLCQGVCCELDNVVCCQNLAMNDSDKDSLKRDYDAAKDLIDKLTAGGFFSKDASLLSKSETVDTARAAGRICASPTVSCPPAVPIVVSGELIDENARETLLSYGIDKIEVIN